MTHAKIPYPTSNGARENIWNAVSEGSAVSPTLEPTQAPT
jgi:hypothetical protein